LRLKLIASIFITEPPHVKTDRPTCSKESSKSSLMRPKLSKNSIQLLSERRP
jgi:hypothetical protein